MHGRPHPRPLMDNPYPREAPNYVTGRRNPRDYPPPYRWPWVHHVGHTIARQLREANAKPTPSNIRPIVRDIVTACEEEEIIDLCTMLANDQVFRGFSQARFRAEQAARDRDIDEAIECLTDYYVAQMR